jgi:hypothetical protein
VTFADNHGRRDRLIRAYSAEARFTDDPLATFGSRAVVEVPGLQKLMPTSRNGSSTMWP